MRTKREQNKWTFFAFFTVPAKNGKIHRKISLSDFLVPISVVLGTNLYTSNFYLCDKVSIPLDEIILFRVR